MLQRVKHKGLNVAGAHGAGEFAFQSKSEFGPWPPTPPLEVFVSSFRVPEQDTNLPTQGLRGEDPGKIRAPRLAR
jgi:hypothetical protein